MIILILWVPTLFFHEFQFESSGFPFCSLCTNISLFMRFFLFSLCISILTSKVLPLICTWSSRYVNQLFMTSLILKKRCYQCWLWWQICLLTRSFLLYTKNFMYYLQLFTVSEMWYCKCIQWVIKLAYCFAVFYHLWLSW